MCRWNTESMVIILLRTQQARGELRIDILLCIDSRLSRYRERIGKIVLS
jgi:hypothetical protein